MAIHSLLYDLPLAADMVVDGIQKYHRIDSLQRPLLPLFGHRQDLVRNPADRAVRDRNTVNILNMGLNISGGHPLGIHRQDLFLNILADAGLVLFQHLRLKLAFPVPRHGYFYIAKARAKRLAAVPIAAVIRVLVL